MGSLGCVSASAILGKTSFWDTFVAGSWPSPAVFGRQDSVGTGSIHAQARRSDISLFGVLNLVFLDSQTIDPGDMGGHCLSLVEAVKATDEEGRRSRDSDTVGWGDWTWVSRYVRQRQWRMVAVFPWEREMSATVWSVRDGVYIEVLVPGTARPAGVAPKKPPSVTGFDTLVRPIR